MADQARTEPYGDPGNPYAAPAVDFSDPWRDGPVDALALRQAHRREESYVKGLAIANFLYTLFFGAAAAFEISILIGYLTGQVNAPWVVRPGWIGMILVLVTMPVAALGAAWGFLRRKRWAVWCELTLAMLWVLMVGLEPLIKSDPRPALEFLCLIAGHLMLAAPMLSAWHLRGSVVFDAEYSAAIAATRGLWFWPKIPGKIILLAFVFFVVALVLFGFSQHR